MPQPKKSAIPAESNGSFEDFLRDFLEYLKAQALRYKNRAGHQEENFRQDVNHKLRSYLEAIGIAQHIDNEFSLLGGGRVDSLIDKVIVEYKSPGRLRPANSSTANREGIDECKKYIERLATQDRRDPGRYRAVVFDGFYFIFCRFVGSEFVADYAIPFSRASARVFLSTILSTTAERPFTAEKLAEAFGPSSEVAKLTIESLLAILASPKKPKTRALFEQWKTNFAQASEFVANEKKALALKDEYRLSGKISDSASLLFSVHTYLAILMKFIAIDVISQFSNLPVFSKSILAKSDRMFVDQIRALERGDQFKTAGINNFLEVDYFSWYVDEFDSNLKDRIRALLFEFEKFDVSTLSAEPFVTSDLIKNLYEKLIPREIRHDLGEYYTPDWLAELTLNEAGYTGQIGKRVLDPSCGSGTFLVSVLKRLKSSCYIEGLDELQTLRAILENIAGFDLNPLAVIAARTNCLIGISEFLGAIRENGEQVTIPIYLSDALLSPKKEGNGLVQEIDLETSVGRLTFPTKIAENDVFFAFIDVLRAAIEGGASPKDFEAALVREGVEPDERISELYKKLLRLHQEGRNGIWANIIKNSFAPLLEKKFDFVLGNPPWINWEHLPETYRTSIEFLWKYYGLFTLKGMQVVLGGGKKDISSLFTYVSIDHFLKDGGTLGFVITQTLFKNQGSADGFRKFSLNGTGFVGETPFTVRAVHDFVQVKPFDAGNRTAVLVIDKKGKTTFPLPYQIWMRPHGERFTNETPLSKVLSTSHKLDCVAEPIDLAKQNSSWLTLPKPLIGFARNYIGQSDYKAIAGSFSGGLNALYWLTIEGRNRSLLKVKNFSERAKIPVPSYEELVEQTYVYPLLCGRDVYAFKASPSLYTFMLQDPETRTGVAEEIFKRNALRTYNLFNREEYKVLLKKRAAYKRYYDPDADPLWTMFNVSKETLFPYKVVWKEQSSKMMAAVMGPQKDEWLGEKIVVPDHKLMLIGLEEEDEAHYVCGFLNSFIVRLVVAGYAVETSMDTHILKNVRIPKFNPNDALHRFLRDRSRQYHRTPNYNEAEYDSALAKFLKVDERLLNEIKEYLGD